MRPRFTNHLAAKCLNHNGEITLIKDNMHPTPSFFSATSELQRFEEGCRRMFKVNIRHGIK